MSTQVALAPVVVFAYRRVGHLQRTLEALGRNVHAERSHIVVYSEASDGDADEGVEAVRAYLRSLGRGPFARLEVRERPVRLGLSASIVDGVTRVVAEHGHAIVLEDDLETSPWFLDFMNRALTRYAHDEDVVAVSGYSYPLGLSGRRTYFRRGADVSWGWGTWARGWALYDGDGGSLLAQLQADGLTRLFDLNDAYPFTQMLEDLVLGRNDSWAVRFQAAAFIREKLTLYPQPSLVRNIGFDGSGMHGGRTDAFDAPLAGEPVAIGDQAVAEDDETRDAVQRFLRSVSTPRRTTLPGRLRAVLATGARRARAGARGRAASES